MSWRVEPRAGWRDYLHIKPLKRQTEDKTEKHKKSGTRDAKRDSIIKTDRYKRQIGRQTHVKSSLEKSRKIPRVRYREAEGRRKKWTETRLQVTAQSERRPGETSEADTRKQAVSVIFTDRDTQEIEISLPLPQGTEKGPDSVQIINLHWPSRPCCPERSCLRLPRTFLQAQGSQLSSGKVLHLLTPHATGIGPKGYPQMVDGLLGQRV